jgi:PAS domain S-box-containing protein/putative nucleotidyltransferase with HDIG domain
VGDQLSAIGQLKTDELADWRHERLADASALCKNAAFAALAKRYLDDPVLAHHRQAPAGWSRAVSEPLRVLVVEDNPADVDLIRKMLPETGLVSFRIESVSRLSTAVARLKAGAFDLVLLDLGLPDSQGLGTFLKLRGAAPDVAVVVFTGNEDQELGVTAVRDGAQDYLIKGQILGDSLARAAHYAVERKRVEEVLRESERELKEAQRLGRIGHWQFDVEAQRLHWSDMVFAIYKRDPKCGPPTVEEEAAYYSSQDAERLRDCARRAIEAGEPYEIEVRVNLPEGRIRDVVAIGTPVKDGHGRVIRVMGIVQDITARKQAEKALQEGEERFRTLYENATVGLYRTTPGGSILLANPTLVRMLGFSSFEELSARNLETDGFEQSYARSEFLERVEGAGEVMGLEAAWTRKDGTRVFVRESARAIRDSEGRTLFYDGTVEDITERRQAELSLSESELRYRQVVENASEAIFVAQGGRIVFLNPTTSAMTGHSSEELMARPFVDFIHPDDRAMVLKRHTRRMKGEKVPSACAFRVVREDGALRWVELNAVLIDWEGEPATLNLVSDITERRGAEMERERLLERQIVLNRLTLALGNLMNLQAILRTLHEEVRTLVDADGFFVSRYHKDTGLITALFAVDEGGERDVSAFPPVPLAPEGKGMQSQVLRTGMPLNVPDWIEGERRMQTVYHIAPDGTFTPPPPEDEREGCTKSALLVPMMLQGEPMGVLQMQSNRPNAYSNEDAELLAGLANVAAISIQNALLVEETRRAAAQVRRGLEGTIKAVALTTEMRDPYTAGHQERVARLACAIAGKIGLGEERVKGLRVAGLLHDLGKVSVPAEILSKPARLTPTEFNLIKAHPQTGYEILKGIDFSWPVAEIVLEHHERLDGSGYPRGLKGEAISLEAKILAVADVVEAMSSHRPYRAALGTDKALEAITKDKGTLYDPGVVDACVELFAEGKVALEGS